SHGPRLRFGLLNGFTPRPRLRFGLVNGALTRSVSEALPRRDLERECLRGLADSLRAGGQRFLLPPAQRAFIQLANLAVNRGGDGDDNFAGAVRNAREHSGALVDLEPGGALLEGEAGIFDVPVVHRLFAVDEACAQVAERADGGEGIAVFRAHLG